MQYNGLSQSWEVPLFSERRLLHQAPRQQALIREVVLSLSGRPVVFARSVFPISSLSGGLAHLRRLQNKSLGAILFKQSGMHRSPFEVAHIAGDSDYLPRHLRQARPPGRAAAASKSRVRACWSVKYFWRNSSRGRHHCRSIVRNEA